MLARKERQERARGIRRHLLMYMERAGDPVFLAKARAELDILAGLENESGAVPGLQGRDAEGYLVWLNADGMDMRVTECHQASAKGTEDGVCCRRCYALVDEAIGGQPVPPYTVVTYAGPKARGWGDSPAGPPYAYRVTLTPPEGDTR